MRRTTLFVLLTLTTLTAAGCGGGGPSPAEISAERLALTQAIAAELRERDVAHQKRKAAKRDQACRTRVAGFVESLRDIDSRLDVGLSYNEYSDVVGDASVERGRADAAAQAGRTCARIASASEAAFGLYNDAVQTWNDCLFDDPISIFDVGCTTDDIEYELQDYWYRASAKVERALDLLEGLGDNVGSPPTYSTFLPRVSSAVETSLYGVAGKRLCDNDAPLLAQEPCAELRELLAGGISEEEEGDLNDALVALTEAYDITPPSLRTEDET
jgi:hypothetical protein